MVAITGQVSQKLIGTDAFQEADTFSITRPATKHNYIVTSLDDLPRAIHEAFYIAASGRPGPVLVDIPKGFLFGSSCHPISTVKLPSGGLGYLNATVARRAFHIALPSCLP